MISQPLRELAVDDPLEHVRGLSLLLGLRLEDPALGLDLGLRNLVGGHVANAGGAGDVDRHLAREGLEVLGAGDEVGLALNFDQDPDLASGVNVGGDDTLAGGPPLPLGRRGLPLDTQDLDRPLDIAVGLREGSLAVHDRRASAVSKRLDLGRADRHQLPPPPAPSCPDGRAGG